MTQASKSKAAKANATAREKGRAAFRAGKTVFANPYQLMAGCFHSVWHREWQQGWNEENTKCTHPQLDL